MYALTNMMHKTMEHRTMKHRIVGYRTMEHSTMKQSAGMSYGRLLFTPFLFVFVWMLILACPAAAATKVDLSGAEIETIPDVDYTGERIMPSPVVRVNGTELTLGTDYSLSWGNNLNAGPASVTVTGRGNYTGTVSVSFQIRPVSMVNTEITNIKNFIYKAGNQIYQSPMIYYAGKRLLSTEYTLSYRNNTELGTAYVMITGQGNFKDTVIRSYSIEDFYLSSSSDRGILTFNEQQMFTENFNVNQKILISAAISRTSVMDPIHYLYIRVKKGSRVVWFDYQYFEEAITPSMYLITEFTPTEDGDYLIELDCSEEEQPESMFFREATKILNIGNTRKDIARASVTGFTDREYTGNSITQSPTVTLDGKTLKEGTDYYVNYYDNAEIGDAYFKVHGIGNYRGTVAQETRFSITPKSLSSDMIVLSPAGFTYDGSLQKPEVTVKNGDFTLREGTDYTVTGNPGGTEPGSYSVSIRAASNGHYSGSADKIYTISGIPITGAKVSVNPTAYTYDGTEKKPEVTVTLNGNVFPPEQYSVEYRNNINAGKAAVIVTAQDSHFTGSVQGTFNIGKADINSDGFAVTAPEDVTYNRSARTPVPVVTGNGKRLVSQTDFKLSYTGNVNAGTAVVTITGNGNYTGSRTTEFHILSKEITDASVTVDDIPEQTLTEESGSVVKPPVTVKDGAAKLTSDEITVIYSDNMKEGTGYAVITGIGNYTGTRRISFSIVKEPEPVTNDLQEEINELENTDTGQYSESDQKAIEEAIRDAKAVLKDESASAGDKEKALTKLETVKKTADKNLAVEQTVQTTEPINESAAPTAAAQEKKILTLKSDTDPKGAVYGLLQARMKSAKKNSVTLQWKKVKGANSYVVYGNKCGKKNKYKRLKTVKGTSFTQKKLKKGTYYKYLIVAVKNGKAIATSKTIHVATAGGKAGNHKSVTVNKKTLTVKAGKKIRITARANPASKKLKVKVHRKLAYESSSRKIATVSAKGVVKGVRKGTCYVYVYAQNGVMARVKVRVN